MQKTETLLIFSISNKFFPTFIVVQYYTRSCINCLSVVFHGTIKLFCLCSLTGKEWVDQGWKDDGTGLGDYPNYTEWSYQNRDPDLPYWDQQDRRHFGEPLHVEHEMLNVWMPDDLTNHKYSHREMALHLAIALGLLGLVVWYSEYVYDAPSRNPAVPKPYPYNNLYLELGGDPDKEPTERDLTRKIPRPHFGW